MKLSEKELADLNNLSEKDKQDIQISFFQSLGNTLTPYAHFEGSVDSAQTSMAVTKFPMSWDYSGNVTPVSLTLTKR